jgi:hypothetical protein
MQTSLKLYLYVAVVLVPPLPSAGHAVRLDLCLVVCMLTYAARSETDFDSCTV